MLAMELINRPSFGRKRTMVFGYAGQTISLLLCSFFVGSLIPFILCAGFANFFYNISINVLFPYTVEVYRTEIRNMALGLG
jgi:MFS family permease|mmetsp:Transcript_9994/g.1487  ORF Transcript_9994/g.1487 Transcript_9994/m.1487 type:complete len:81 (+) Transcript_9994:434-676(+)